MTEDSETFFSYFVFRLHLLHVCQLRMLTVKFDSVETLRYLRLVHQFVIIILYICTFINQLQYLTRHCDCQMLFIKEHVFNEV